MIGEDEYERVAQCLTMVLEEGSNVLVSLTHLNRTSRNGRGRIRYLIEPVMSQFGKPVQSEGRRVIRIGIDEVAQVVQLESMAGIVAVAQMCAASVEETVVES